MKALLELEHVSKRFVQPLDVAGKIARALGADVSDEVVHAVDDVSFGVNEGEVVGLVGESGCGKSTLGRMVAGILPPSAGALRYRGQERIGLQVQMIFQDPFASLNPRMRVEDIVGEAPLVHGIVKKEALGDYLDQLFARCGLDPSYKKRFPHQFSGGQRSRIGIARALAVKPELLVCDEAVAALDVSIQAQILNLFMKLREDLALTYLFISHDLGVVEHLSDRVVIMYLGRVVESAPAEEIFLRANHPYTQALLKQVPRLDTRKTQFKPIVGEIPSPLSPPTGCHFHPRCPHAMARCREQAPPLKDVAPGHLSACHLNER
jgi:peptide/nickel transport system ATP-binding protein